MVSTSPVEGGGFNLLGFQLDKWLAQVVDTARRVGNHVNYGVGFEGCGRRLSSGPSRVTGKIVDVKLDGVAFGLREVHCVPRLVANLFFRGF